MICNLWIYIESTEGHIKNSLAFGEFKFESDSVEVQMCV